MTATTTADKIAAMELIEEHGLDLYSNRGGSRTCAGPLGICGVGSDDIAAVKAWADKAGVEWKPPKVVPMWCVVGNSETTVATANQEAAASVLGILGGKMVPCEVVIRKETEATP